VPPPKPAPKTGVDRIAELHSIRRDTVNEVTIEDEGPVEDWGQFCMNLLQVSRHVLMDMLRRHLKDIF
jgi:hypothetical protein